MSIHTFLQKSSLSVSASLLTRGDSIAADGGVEQNLGVIFQDITGNLSYVDGNLTGFAGTLIQQATHLFVTDYIFGQAVFNGDLLQIADPAQDDDPYLSNLRLFSILAYQPLGSGRNEMSEFLLQEVREFD